MLHVAYTTLEYHRLSLYSTYIPTISGLFAGPVLCITPSSCLRRDEGVIHKTGPAKSPGKIYYYSGRAYLSSCRIAGGTAFRYTNLQYSSFSMYQPYDQSGTWPFSEPMRNSRKYVSRDVQVCLSGVQGQRPWRGLGCPQLLLSAYRRRRQNKLAHRICFS